MANYYGTSRTNYFAIKLEMLEEFKADMKRLDIEIVGKPPERLALISNDESGWPSYDPEAEENDGDGSTDFCHQVSKYLTPGSIAIMVEVGNEKARYVSGHAVAVDSEGACVWVNLEAEILKRAKEKWPAAEITEPSY